MTRPPSLPRKSFVWAIPPLALAYQFAAKEIAEALPARAFALADAGALLRSPWPFLLIASEIVALAIWLLVLSEVKLSEAFPMTALTYVLVIALSWTFFHEQPDARTIVGSAAILTGVWLIGRGEPGAEGR